MREIVVQPSIHLKLFSFEFQAYINNIVFQETLEIQTPAE